MKICEFCGTANNDDAVKCSSCGGPGFKFKCNNCGTEFKDGKFCPKCGVKAGQEPRTCPVCKTQYYTNACPTCGYVPGQSSGAGTVQQPPTQPKRKTWLWVLGWIFIFPVPLMLILLKKKNMNKGLKIGIIIAAWVVYVLFIAIGAANDNKESSSKGDLSARETAVVTEAETKAPKEKETKAPTEKKTEAPTEEPAEKPTQAPTDAPTPITFTEYTSNVDAGAEASVTIQGAPNTQYSINVTYDSGSTAKGLEPKTSDDNGYITWTWKVGTNTNPGEHTITVTGGGSSESVKFTTN